MSQTDSELTDYLFQKGHRISKPLIQDIQAYTAKKVKEAKDAFHNHYSGKPEKHPVPCEDCGSDYWIDWILPHPVFNAVCPGGNGYLCLPCFTKRFEKLTSGQNDE